MSTHVSIPIAVTEQTIPTSSSASARTIRGFRGRTGPLENVPPPPQKPNSTPQNPQYENTQTQDFPATFGAATRDQTGNYPSLDNYKDFIAHLRTRATVGRSNRNTYIWIEFQLFDGDNKPARNSPYIIMRLDDYYITHFSIYTGPPTPGAEQLFTAILDSDYGETVVVPHANNGNVNFHINVKTG